MASVETLESLPGRIHKFESAAGRHRLAHTVRGSRALLLALLFVFGLLALPARAESKPDPSEICLGCHGDKSFSVKHGAKTISLYVDGKKFASSIHAGLSCTGCHSDLDVNNLPHGTPKPVNCGTCHSDEGAQYAKSIHGVAVAKGDPLAPHCWDCHGNHDIVPVKERGSAVYPLKIPFVCGRCHREGTPVQRNRDIDEHNILSNYTESIHGEGLLKQGLVVAANCASCHSAHNIRAPRDPESTISRRNIAATCTKCHAGIEEVHRKIIRGELWEKAPNTLPACVDCHAPHKIREVFYEQGMADADCQSCHGKPGLKAANGRSMYVNQGEVRDSMHAKVACAQCHSEVNVSLHTRPCAAITHRVDCTKCHAQEGQIYETSIHGQLHDAGNKIAPFCTDCHGTHHVLGKINPQSPIFPTNIPNLCGGCHREGHKAAVRYSGSQHEIVANYTESIHGQGLLKAGLTVTATCASCHSAHHELPASDPNSSVNPAHLADTCGACHSGIEKQFNKSIHSPLVTRSSKPLPVCSTCHTAHQIQRTDATGFKLEIMTKCGNCHREQADSYFDTYHGKVSRLGYAKTAKCADCHGSHDILPVSDPRSSLSPENVVATCHKCHSDATRRFAGYLTHATHHDPKKYAVLYWVFWSMTGLLIGTFIVGGVHTLLWMPRAFQMRRELREEEAREAAEDAAAEAAERAAKEKGENDVQS